MKTKTHKKADIAAKLAARPKTYNLMVGYDPILETEVRNVLDENKVKTKITTECYFYVKDLTEEQWQRIANLVKGIKFEFKPPQGGNPKVYRIRYISATKAMEMNLGKIKRHHKKKTAGTVHSAGSKSTNYEKKLSTRIKKAVKAITLAEVKKRSMTTKKAKSKGIQKPVQQKLNFKAAA